MREKLREQGYDREEEYFSRKDKELIEKLKKKKEEEGKDKDK